MQICIGKNFRKNRFKKVRESCLDRHNAHIWVSSVAYWQCQIREKETKKPFTSLKVLAPTKCTIIEEARHVRLFSHNTHYTILR